MRSKEILQQYEPDQLIELVLQLQKEALDREEDLRAQFLHSTEIGKKNRELLEILMASLNPLKELSVKVNISDFEIEKLATEYHIENQRKEIPKGAWRSYQNGAQEVRDKILQILNEPIAILSLATGEPVFCNKCKAQLNGAGPKEKCDKCGSYKKV